MPVIRAPIADDIAGLAGRIDVNDRLDGEQDRRLGEIAATDRDQNRRLNFLAGGQPPPP